MTRLLCPHPSGTAQLWFPPAPTARTPARTDWGGTLSRFLLSRFLRAGFLRQLARFTAVGVASTAVSWVIFGLLQASVGAQVANVIAVVLTALGNNAGHRRLTFGRSGPDARGRHNAQGLLVTGLALAITSGSLAALAFVTTNPSAGAQAVVLVTANALAGLLHFALLRLWVFRR